MTPKTVARIRTTILGGLLAACVAAPAALADPWARDQYRRENAPDLIGRWLKTHPQQRPDMVDRIILRERVAAATHDERILPPPDLVDRFVARSAPFFITENSASQNAISRQQAVRSAPFVTENSAGQNAISRHQAVGSALFVTENSASQNRLAQLNEQSPTAVAALPAGGSTLDWGDLAIGMGIGVGLTLAVGGAALGRRGRRLAHS